jgi:thiopeptide-type bacteriocin biosynthesis protein
MAMGTSVPTVDSFFCLRTPLLPWTEFRAWNEGLEACGPEAGDAALARDREHLRGKLRTLLGRPEILEALQVASPDLVNGLPRWLQDPEGEKGQRVETALVRYFSRMCRRCTPFGLFAGLSTGHLGEASRLDLGPSADYQRRSRLDLGFLAAALERAHQDPDLRERLRYRPNNSLYRCGGRWRYGMARTCEGERSYQLAAVMDHPGLAVALRRAAPGASLAELREALVEAGYAAADAAAFVNDLALEQLLVPDLEPCCTGQPASGAGIRALAEAEATRPLAGALERAEALLAGLDRRGLGNPLDAYRELAQVLEPFKTASSPSLWQVDLFKPAARAALGPRFRADLLEAVRLQRAVSIPDGDGFRDFRQAFRRRYEYRWVPLAAVLDPEQGLAYRGPGREPLEAGPLVRGLGLDVPEPPDPDDHALSARERHLLERLLGLRHQGGGNLELDAADLEAMAAGQRSVRLPQSFILVLELAAGSAEALDSGDYRALLKGMLGPSAARMLGRFCHGDPVLLAELRRHLRAEEALRPEAVFAEIAHLPSGRMGNVLARPLLRAYELPYLGRSGAPPERWIPLQDLQVGLVGDRVALWSTALEREVLPRLSSAANIHRRPSPLYQFLAALQNQDAQTWCGFKWGRLEQESSLPRVTHGRFVLARAQWRIGAAGMRLVAAAQTPQARFRAFQQLRRERGWPAQMLLGDGDHELPVTLDNPLCLDALWGVIKGWKDAVLLEDFPGERAQAIRGAEGRFAGELLVPCLATDAPQGGPGPILETDGIRHGPGSDWLYAKLYTGPASADQLLAGPLAELVRAALASREADTWFFVRYADPEPHLRLRFHGQGARLCSALLPRLHRTLDPLLRDGWIWKLQLDTYEPELARYGGLVDGAGMERLFQEDSETALEILAAIPGDEGPDATRWPLALLSVDEWLASAGLGVEARLALVRDLQDQDPSRTGAALKAWLGKRYREARPSLEALLAGAAALPAPLAEGRAALAARSRRVAPLLAGIRALGSAQRRGRSLEDLLASLAHMSVNRLLRSTAREEERIIQHFLVRLYDSRLARGREFTPD